MVTTQGIPLSRYHASKQMKAFNLVSCQSQKHRYRKANQEHITIPNHLYHQFAVTSPNQVWVGDVTYVWIGHRWMYLAGVIDLFSRKSVGWTMSLSLDNRLTGKALIMAYESRHKPRGIMHHRDEDSRYTSRYYHQLLWRNQIKQSLSR
ncbi:Integrase core domain [Photobacterium damselae]|nr:Integrase core domain [Photobacterium damselae]